MYLSPPIWLKIDFACVKHEYNTIAKEVDKLRFMSLGITHFYRPDLVNVAPLITLVINGLSTKSGGLSALGVVEPAAVVKTSV